MILKKRSAISTAATVGIIVVIIIVAAVGVYYYTTISVTPTTSSTSAPPTTSTSAPVTSTSSPTTSATSPVTLNIITFTDPSNAWLQAMATQFEASHPGVTINVIAQGFSSYTTTELTSLKAASPTYNIITFTSTSALGFAPYVTNLQGLVSLNSSDIPAPQLNFGGYYAQSNGTNELIGVPYDSSTFTIFYNATLLSNPTLNSQFQKEYGFSMSPPWSSWKDILDIDNFLVTQTHTTHYGLVVDGSESHDIIDTYPAIFGYYYAANSAISDNHPNGGLLNWNIMFNGFTGAKNIPAPSFNSTAGVQALQMMYNLMQYDPQPAGTVVNYGTVFAPLQAAESWGALMFTADATTLLTSKNISSSIAVADLPGGYAETGTDFYAVNKYSANQNIAAEFIQYLVSPKANAQIYQYAGEFPISKAGTAILTSNMSLSAPVRTVIQGVFNTALVGWANPPNLPITSSTLIPAFNQPIYAFLTGNTNSTSAAQQALNAAAAAWIKAVG